MSYNVWIPMLLGLAIRISGSFIAFAVPQSERANSKNSEEAETDSSSEPLQEADMISKTQSKLTQYRAMLNFVLKNTDIALIISTFTLSGAIRTWLDYFLQYISKRYRWSLEQASFLQFSILVSKTLD